MPRGSQCCVALIVLRRISAFACSTLVLAELLYSAVRRNRASNYLTTPSHKASGESGTKSLLPWLFQAQQLKPLQSCVPCCGTVYLFMPSSAARTHPEGIKYGCRKKAAPFQVERPINQSARLIPFNRPHATRAMTACNADVPNHLGHDHHNHHQHRQFHRWNFGRNQHSAPVQSPQPKTKPDNAFGIWGAANTAGQQERIDEARRNADGYRAELFRWLMTSRSWETQQK